MTDNEIIKALEEERAMLDNGYSTYLMYGGKKDAQMEKEIDLISNALDLINRQQAEIERLNGNLFTISNACKQRRNEAIKEFADRLCKGRVSNDPVVIAVKTELKEMVGK